MSRVSSAELAASSARRARDETTPPPPTLALNPRPRADDEATVEIKKTSPIGSPRRKLAPRSEHSSGQRDAVILATGVIVVGRVGDDVCGSGGAATLGNVSIYFEALL